MLVAGNCAPSAPILEMGAIGGTNKGEVILNKSSLKEFVEELNRLYQNTGVILGDAVTIDGCTNFEALVADEDDQGQYIIAEDYGHYIVFKWKWDDN